VHNGLHCLCYILAVHVRGTLCICSLLLYVLLLFSLCCDVIFVSHSNKEKRQSIVEGVMFTQGIIKGNLISAVVQQG